MSLDKQGLEIIQNDIKALYLGNLNTVEFDLNLPVRGQLGSSITWETSNDKIITEEGKVIRPAFGIGNREVELYATFRYGEASETKVYKITVLEQENKIQVTRQYPMNLETGTGVEFYLPEVTVIDTADGRTITHAITWENGGRRIYEEEGSYEEQGVLTGTKIVVSAKVTAIAGLVKQRLENGQMIHGFDSGEVRLCGDSPFKRAQDRSYEFLLSVDDNQMLYNFRRAAGLDTLGAPEMIGWDSPDGLLRGHTTGHYLSALALCYRAVKDEEIQKKAIHMVEVLGECQDAFQQMEGYHKGFLSAYSEEQFDLLEAYTKYPTIWAPYYTLHKIMAGLIDCYQLVGIEKALTIVTKVGDWVHERLSRLTHEQRSRMWSMYIAGEFGGMNETMAELYRITGKAEYMETARLFDNDKLFYPMSMKADALDEMHANQHIPQVVGAIKMFSAFGEKYYYDIAEFFWNAVTEDHCYAIGGTGEGEMFHAAKRIAGQLTKNTAESCASYNMLKLTKELYTFKPEKRYMDYYERTMTNHILSTCDHEPNGGTIYFLPLAPGHSKGFDVENSCCHGTGLENHFKYVESIYFHKENELLINQLLPSVLEWKEKNFELELSVDEIRPGDIRLAIGGDTSGFITKIRIPEWSAGSYCLRINGDEVSRPMEVDGYILMNESLQEGDIVEVSFSCTLRLEETPDDSQIVAVFYGPYCLAAITSEKDFITLAQEGRALEEILVQKENTLEFLHEELEIVWRPLYQVYHENFQVYVRR